MRLLSVILAFAFGSTLFAAPRVLVFMLDGARADVMEATASPTWQMLKENRWADGYHAAWSLTAGIEPYVCSASAPNHTTIATGKLAKHHKVFRDPKEFSNFSHDTTPTWQDRIGRKFPTLRTAHAFNWAQDITLSPRFGNYRVIHDSDAVKNRELVELLKRPDAPGALMVFDDAPDHAGHTHRFYPYSNEYLQAVSKAMQRLGNLLDAIKARPSFAEEDWLIVICSDHGGVGKIHYKNSVHCYTVPLLYCGKNIPEGMMAGRPNNLGIAANVLRHFGLDAEVAELDDTGAITIAPQSKPQPTSAGLLYDIVVHNGKIVNRAATHSMTAHGNLSLGEDSFNTRNGYITLDELKNFKGQAFTFAVTMKCNLATIVGNPAIFSNKDWRNGENPGFVLFAKRDQILFNTGCENAPVNYVVTSPKRMDLYHILPETPDEWTMIAFSIDSNGLITALQKGEKGRQYWFCFDAKGVNIATELDWNIGQDGTGKQQYPAPMDIRNVRFWNRALTLDELRKLNND